MFLYLKICITLLVKLNPRITNLTQYLGKVPLRSTPHFVAYHLESKTYAVVTSTSETTEKVWKFNGDDKELVTEERDERFPWPTVDAFQLQLYSPISWEAIPGKTYF